MKERILYEDEFEKQLKEKADQFKMYPSDKVWNQVYSSLHTRRRRFVAGMTFLIGSILILAGTQLISPSRNSHSKTIATKINTPLKPATVADLHNYTAGSFSSSENISDESRSSDASLSTIPPFVRRSSSPAVDSYSGSNEMLESLPERIQTTGQVKSIQQANPNVSGKADALTAILDLNESGQTATDNTTLYTLSAEGIPEKSPTQLTHIHNDRLRWEIYIAPTLNTHYLNGLNYQTTNQPIQSAPIRVGYFTNVNGFVDNTPVLGYDVGGNILYRISKNISLKAGLEFSYSRYYIKAYNPVPGQATASLNSYLGYAGDSLVSYSTGTPIEKNPQHYQNKYYQLSIPVGVDMKVAGNGKLQLHLGGTLQPSYLLNTDAYVLSDDLTTYTKDAQAFRRWNLNAGAEVYLSYAIGKIRWELGPQVRYQIFSTYKNSIPLQENMLNYGIRIGISKSIR